MKYSDLISKWLKEEGFTHFFYVGGGNIMHLTESLSNELIGIPVIHEVAAVIASEYFNSVAEGNNKSLALVTAGPGLTNTITGIAGAWLENRFVLIIGGQVKTSDLKNNINLRQRGIQEIDGVTLVKSICKIAKIIDKPINKNEFIDAITAGYIGKKGPVFLEIPIDVQAFSFQDEINEPAKHKLLDSYDSKHLELIFEKYNASKKPIILIGGGVSYETAVSINKTIIDCNIPFMTTYNGADRIGSEYLNYFGRPNTWGQRSANIIIQKADLIVVFGSRLGLQQTGFNWQEFGRSSEIIQIDIDKEELFKGHPNVDYKINADCNPLLREFVKNAYSIKYENWINECLDIRKKIPRIENVNTTSSGYISPYDFIISLEKLTTNKCNIIPCSSGSAFTLTMQLWNQKFGQRILTNKSLASMGYGLSGAIGTCFALPNSKTILIEGDGGFAQNIQEIGTAKINNLNLKIFIFNDQGHASIRMTQNSYFNGKYLGCDRNTGLGLPNWFKVFEGWDINVFEVNVGFQNNKEFLKRFNNNQLEVFIVSIDPKQTYYPKISSSITESGNMISNPLDIMTPEIDYLND